MAALIYTMFITINVWFRKNKDLRTHTETNNQIDSCKKRIRKRIKIEKEIVRSNNYYNLFTKKWIKLTKLINDREIE